MQASGTVFVETELDQALNGWNQGVVQAEGEKASKRQEEEKEKADQERAKMDRENMLLPSLKKRIFRKAAAALTDSEETEPELKESDITVGKPISKRKKVGDAQDRKRKLRDRAIALDEKYVNQGDRLVEVVQSMSRAFATQDEIVENKKIQELEKESQAVRREVADIKETVQDTSSKVDCILNLLSKK